MTIKITNLPSGLSDDAIKAEIEELFSSNGYDTVEFSQDIEAGENEKVAYISFSYEVAEKEAVDKLDGSTTTLFPNPIHLEMDDSGRGDPHRRGQGQPRGSRPRK